MSTNSSLVIRTGLQGNGKTLNTIKELDAQAFREGRPVYYHNVTGLKPEKLQAAWFEFDDPMLWFELPNDSIIVVDEAQGSVEHQRFGVRDPRKPVPLHISHIEIMRKKGHELHLITQDPRFLDVHARRLCNCHIHYWRAFGSSQIVRFIMPRVKDDVEKIASFKDCEKSIVKLDKKFFDVYESAQAKHHFQFKVPRAAWVLIACVLALGLIAYSLRDRFGGADAQPETETPSTLSGGVSGLASQVLDTPKENRPLSKAQYFAQQKPRIADVPSSAPVYDELTKPVAFPKTFCVMTEDVQLMERNRKRMAVSVMDGKAMGCQCYTQQNTRLKTSFEYCADVVQNGRFDPTVADRGSSANMQVGGQQHLAGQPMQIEAPAVAAPAERLTIVNSGKPGHLW